MIEVKIDDKKVVKALQDLQRAVGDLSPAFKAIGDILVESTKQRFESGTGPDGIKWPDNAPATIERKGRNQPLIDEGTLMESIHKELTGDNSLEIGTVLGYAAMQQFGGKKSEFPWLWGDIPERSSLGLSDGDRDAILAEIDRHLTSGF